MSLARVNRCTTKSRVCMTQPTPKPASMSNSMTVMTEVDESMVLSSPNPTSSQVMPMSGMSL